MVRLFGVFVFFLVLVAGSQKANAGLCITSTQMYGATSPQTSGLINSLEYEVSFYTASAPRCESVQALKNVSMVLGVSLQIGAITALCTGAGLPVTIALEVASAGLLVANGILDNIECVDEENEQLMEQKAREAVCAEFMQYGIPCRGGRSEKLRGTGAPIEGWSNL